MREWRFLSLAGVLFLVSTGFNGYNTEQQTSSEDSSSVQRDHLSLAQRLGYAILTNAGYATVRLPPEEELKVGAPLVLDWHYSHPDFRCIDDTVKLGEPGADKVDAFLLLASIVAAEKYNRPAFVRSSEALLAHAVYSVTGRAPDFSLGLAQIRPSTVRADLTQQLGALDLGDDALLDYTLDDCTNIVAADHRIRALLTQVDPSLSTERTVAAVARAYNGASPTGEDGRMYEMAVVGAYSLLPGGGISEEEGAAPAPPGFVTCARFAVGSPVGRFDGAVADDEPWPSEELRGQLAAATEIVVSFADREPGPSQYRDRLSTLRTDWVVQQLLAAGIRAEIVHVERTKDPLCPDATTSAAAVLALPPQPVAGGG
jgi:hypothetical protein